MADALTAANVAKKDALPKLKEIKLWNEQLTELQPQVNAIVQKLNQHNEDAERVSLKVAKHNADCSGELPDPLYERCKGEVPYLQSEINRISTQKTGIEAERTPLLRRINDIESRRNELVTLLEQIKARHDSARSKLDAAQDRIASITSRLKTECATPNTPEGLVYCAQIDWDGARLGLDAPILIPQPFTATSN